MKFGITKDFDSSSGRIGKTDRGFELIKVGDEYTLCEYVGGSIGEIYTFTKEELRTLWGMLSARE